MQVQAVAFDNSYPVTHRFVGQINNASTSVLGLELGGVIRSVLADVGDRIESGQPLAQLDTSLLQAEAAQLEANRNQILAQLSLNRATRERQQTLQQQGYQSQQQLDELISQEASLQANLSELDAALQANDLRQQKSTLRSPYAGILSQRNLAPGQVVAAGQAVFTLVPEQGAEARIGVPVALLNRLKTEQAFTLLHGKEPIEATLLGRSAEVDSATRTVELRFALPSGRSWLNGDLIYLSLVETVSQRATAIPADLLISGLRGRWNVLVAAPQEDGHILQRRDVTVLHTDQNQVYIDGALIDDEWLVSAGLHKLVQGQHVELVINPETQP
ncbi:efflux RND transporter periplasmic adaptor subunit [Ferrimonas pelagia]|uniref:Efflux RND transporter periplasmic adaptor subunit n=1 Tax=Ferrimonas pelagia TaxID=1177826 RepID=A0ABP9FAU9_9GAMM